MGMLYQVNINMIWYKQPQSINYLAYCNDVNIITQLDLILFSLLFVQQLFFVYTPLWVELPPKISKIYLKHMEK